MCESSYLIGICSQKATFILSVSRLARNGQQLCAVNTYYNRNICHDFVHTKVAIEFEIRVYVRHVGQSS